MAAQTCREMLATHVLIITPAHMLTQAIGCRKSGNPGYLLLQEKLAQVSDIAPTATRPSLILPARSLEVTVDISCTTANPKLQPQFVASKGHLRLHSLLRCWTLFTFQTFLIWSNFRQNWTIFYFVSWIRTCQRHSSGGEQSPHQVLIGQAVWPWRHYKQTLISYLST